MIEALLMTVALSGKPELPEYRGAHYTPKAEKFLECVAARESGWPRKGAARADGPYGSGLFQMVKSTSRVYALKAGYPEWADKRAAEWPPYVQTEVAYVLLNPYPKKKGLEGKHHWSTDHTFAVLGKRGKEC